MAPVVLEYGKPPRWYERRWLGALVFITIATILAACWHWRRAIGDHVALLQWQRQWMSYTAPPERVVFELDPVRIKSLLESDPRYRSSGESTDRAFAWFNPTSWTPNAPMRSEYDGIGWEPGPAFVHARRAVGGSTRLLSVGIAELGLPCGIGFYAKLVQPASIFSGPEAVRVPRQAAAYYFVLKEGETLRLFAGQADADDASHFTIDYEIGSSRGTIDGWLKRDDTVQMVPRDERVAATRWSNKSDELFRRLGQHREKLRRLEPPPDSLPSNPVARAAVLRARLQAFKAKRDATTVPASATRRGAASGPPATARAP